MGRVIAFVLTAPLYSAIGPDEAGFPPRGEVMMLDSIGRSYRLALRSFRVLRQDPVLMLFPTLSFAGVAAAMAMMGGSLLRAGQLPLFDETTPAGVIGLFLAYLMAYFIIVYFQVALVACVRLRLSGSAPTVGYGIGIANNRLGAILSWVVVAAVFGVVLRLVESLVRRRAGPVGAMIGNVVVGVVGVAWNLATFFVVPVIAAQGVGGLEAGKRSAAIIQKRWGEVVMGAAGITLFVVLAGLGVMALILLLAIGASALLPAPWVGTILLFGLGLAFVLMLAAGAALDTIYTAVVHRFATTGEASGGFTMGELEGSFRSEVGASSRPVVTPRFPST